MDLNKTSNIVLSFWLASFTHHDVLKFIHVVVLIHVYFFLLVLSISLWGYVAVGLSDVHIVAGGCWSFPILGLFCVNPL